MKKIILTTTFSLAVLIASAQLYVTTTDKVGVGTSAPASKFDVEGGVSIGANYSGTTAAPTNGAIIEGDVGIGISNPSRKLHVAKDGGSNGVELYVQDLNSTNAGGIFVGSYLGNAYVQPGASGKALMFWDFSSERMRIQSGGNVCIGNTNNTYKLDITGTANCTSNTWTSDVRKKKNIQNLSLNMLDIINELRPVTFEWKEEMDGGMHGTQMGFIAQELEMILPSMVVTGNDSLQSKAVKYSELFPVLVKAMQEQQNMINNLITTVVSLQSAVENCCSLGERGNNNGNGVQGKSEVTLQIELENNNQTILYQNEPNPFDGSTVIRYFIPDNISGGAFVVFYDMYGKEVNKLELKERGFGKIEANTENLASGIYSYSIIVDGKSIDTKKMLKSK